MLSPVDFDEALVEKLRSVYSNLVVAATDQQFQEASRDNMGRVVLPLLGVWRTGYSLNPVDESFAGINGLGRYAYTDPDTQYTQQVSFTTFPVVITYQLDIWSVRRRDGDKLAVELLWWLKRHPNVEVVITKPYEWKNADSKVLVTGVTENSEPSEFSDRGRIYHVTIDCQIDGYIYHVQRDKVALTIPVQVLDYDSGEVLDEVTVTADVPEE